MTKPDAEELLFNVDSSFLGDPVSGKSIRLARHRYETHIIRGHTETIDRLHDIEYALRSPHYVANCVPGPGNKHVGGVCFVRTDATPKTPIKILRQGKTVTVDTLQRKSYMHVMVQKDDHGPYVATALFSENYHGDIIWENPFDEEREDGAPVNGLDLNYDEGADILYLSKGEPVPAYSTPGKDGLLLRYAMDDQRPCGVTIMSYRDWDTFHDQLAEHIAAFLQIERTEAKQALDHLKLAA